MTADALERWQARFQLTLAWRGLDGETIDARVEEVTRHCAESGEDPEEAFGPPDEFAETVLAEHGPPAHTSDDAYAPLVHVGYVGGLLAVVGWVSKGWMLSVHGAGMTGTLLLLCTVAWLHAVRRLRDNGRPRAASWAVGGIGLGILASAAAFQLLPAQELFRVPTPVLLLLALAALAWGWTRSGTARERSATPEESLAMPPDRWLRELAGLLEGRHDLPPQRARELTTEAAVHLAETGGTPQEEFGQVEEYAAGLAAHEPKRPPWWRRESTLRTVRLAFPAGLLALNLAEGGSWWFSAVLALLILADLGTLVRAREVRAQDE